MRVTFLRTVLASALVLTGFLPATAADAPKVDAADRARMESVIHDYLLSHPEVILQAVQAMQTQAQADKEKAVQDILVQRAADLLNDPDTQAVGNLKSNCTIVEFFDNQCPYCQANEPELQKLIKQDGRIKLVLKEFPILGPISLVSAKAALASVRQGKYVAFHTALLAHKGHYDKEAVVDEIAKSVGLDLDRMHKDMEDPAIADALHRNVDLARSLRLTGTPGFVIGKQVVDGAASVDELRKYVSEACAKTG